jgi:GH24 family phage-related lysozyme (muramidase)
MAKSRIPGPAGIRADPLPIEDMFDNDGDASWPHMLGRPFHHHQPGSLGIEPEPRWMRMHFSTTPRIDYERLIDDLKVQEYFVPFMYLCSKGRVTVGIGNMLPSVEEAKKLPFTNSATGAAASDDEIASAYAAVSQMQKDMYWKKYKRAPSLEISEEFARELALTRLKKEYLPAVVRIFFDFEEYPSQAQRFIVDMAYNGGAGYFAKRHMVEPIRKRDWKACIPLVQVPVNGKGKGRYDWRLEMLNDAAAADAY